MSKFDSQYFEKPIYIYIYIFMVIYLNNWPMKDLNFYESPAVEVIEVITECGFAQSKPNQPNCDGFDGEQQW
jgi:hypothetical protein